MMDSNKERLFGIDQAKLIKMLDGFTDPQLKRVQDDVPNARGRTAREVRESLRKSVRRFYDELTSVSGGLVKSGREAVTLVFEALYLRHSGSSSYNAFDDVELPVFQGFLKAANEYSWGSASCAPGSISMMIAVAEARLEDDDSPGANGDEGTPAGGLNIGQLLHELEKIRSEPGSVERLRAELQNRLLAFVRKGTGHGQRLSDTLELMTDGDHYEFAINELRGMAFTAVYEEYKGTFFKRRDAMSRLEIGQDRIAHGVKSHLVDLTRVADLLVGFLHENPMEIPATLNPVLEGRGPEVPVLRVQTIAEQNADMTMPRNSPGDDEPRGCMIM